MTNYIKKYFKLNNSKFRYQSILMVFVLIVFSHQLIASENDFIWPSIKLSKAENKRFTFIRHYEYKERKYVPPVAVKIVEKIPEYNANGPEDLISRQISAMVILNYDGWLTTWDGVAQKRIIQHDQKNKEQRIAKWKKEYQSAKFYMTKWIELGQFVVINYRIVRPDRKDAIEARAFRIKKGQWRATFDLDPYPGVKNFITESKHNKVEQVIR